ncbi:MAG: TFIIB-type zinc ribbon-containing protein [Telluria sp.]
MDCPVCKNVKLVMSDRQGIEIDYCPNCRGVWLDRGELDKIIDRSVGAAPPAAQPMQQPVQQQVRHDQHQGNMRPPDGFGHSQPSQGYPQPSHGYPQQGYHKKKKREGFLGELFDFD